MDLSTLSDDQLQQMAASLQQGGGGTPADGSGSPPSTPPAQSPAPAPPATATQPVGAGSAPDLSGYSDAQLDQMAQAAQQGTTAAPLTIRPAPPTNNAAAAYVAHAIGGAPVVGPYALAGMQHLSAWQRSMDNGTSFDDELATVQGADNARTVDHPTASKIGDVSGAVISTAPLMAAAPTAFGIGETPLLGRALTGGVTGATIGGTDAAVRSEGTLPQRALQTAVGTGLGFGFGLGGPVLGDGIGAAMRRLNGQAVTEAPGVPKSARDYLVERLLADNPNAVMANMKQFSDQGMLADYGPGLRGIAQGLSTKPGPAQQPIMQALTERNLGTNARLGSVVDGALGPAVSPQAYTNALSAQRSALHAQLPGVYAAAPPVDVAPIVSDIGRRLGPAVGQQESVLRNAQGWISDPGQGTPAVAAVAPQRVPVTDPATGRVIRYQTTPGTPAVPGVPAGRQPITDPVALGNAKTELDGLINYGNPSLGVTPGGVSKAQGAAADVRGGINQALRDQVPGYSGIMDQSSALARQMEAVESGTKALGSGPMALRPDDFAQAYGALSPAEQQAYRVGMRGVVDSALGTKANDLVALKGVTQGDNGWNSAKIGTAWGQDASDKLNTAVDAESRFRDTYNKVLQNSETARNQAAAKGLQDAEYDPFQIGHVHNLTMEGIAATAAKQPLNAMLRMFQPAVDNTARDLGLAKAVTATGTDRNRILAQLLRAQSTEDANSRLGQGAAQAVTTAVAGSYPAALAAVLRGDRR